MSKLLNTYSSLSHFFDWMTPVMLESASLIREGHLRPSRIEESSLVWNASGEVVKKRLNLPHPMTASLAADLYASGSLRMDGLKLFTPTDEQFNAMAITDPRLKFSEYRQPFPAIAIDYRWGDYLGGSIAHIEALNAMVMTVYRYDGTSLCRMLFDDTDSGTIADSLNKDHRTFHHIGMDDSEEKDFVLPPLDNDYEAFPIYCRVMINFALLAVRFGVEDVSDHKRLDRLKRLYAKDPSASNLKQLHSFTHKFKLVQTIKLLDRKRRDHPDSDPSGATVRPHWRSGHFRSQRYGTGRSESKIIFIAPVWVNGDRPETDSLYHKKG